MTSTIDPATTLAEIVTNHPDLARELERRVARLLLRRPPHAVRCLHDR